MSNKRNILIIGGGAAGFFAAIQAARKAPEAKVIILEKGKTVLNKVRISGGGRCNVTHACFVPADLVKFYPRGEKELLGPFNRFCTGDTIDWYENHGVPLKIEEDGRMFPTSDSSQSIIDCLRKAAQASGVQVLTQYRVEQILPPKRDNDNWTVETNKGSFIAHKLLVATGSNTPIWKQLNSLGHTIISPVPSLFTFNCKDVRLKDMAGVSFPIVSAQIKAISFESQGPLLITHWGFSGPAILKLSAFAARELAALNYKFDIHINWLDQPKDSVLEQLMDIKKNHSRQQIQSHAQFQIPIRFWRNLVKASAIPEKLRWADLSKKQLLTLADQLCNAPFKITGKSTYKEEFVTAGGLDLKEVNFKTFESKKFPGLYFAGEVLNIDAVTGGFNFQAAWTGAWIAGHAMAESI